MNIVIETESYLKAIDTLSRLIGSEVDCALRVKEGKIILESSNDEAWIQVPLKSESINGEGKVFTKLQYLKVIRPNLKTKTIEMLFNGEDHISVKWGRVKGVIRLIDEEDAIIQRPESPVKISAMVPEKMVRFATGATAFKPLLDSSSPDAIIEINNKEFNISSYDNYIGTHYGTTDEQIKTKDQFDLLVEMNYWRSIVSRMGADETIKIGADEHNFRIKTKNFDLYHAVIQEDTQDVKEVITTIRSESDVRAVVEFDGNAVTEAIDAAKGIIRSAEKNESCFYLTFKPNGTAILFAESETGEMETEFDIYGFDGDEEVEFKVSSHVFADTLKLTRDEALKYGPVKMTVTGEYVILESLKVPASSLAPVLGD